MSPAEPANPPAAPAAVLADVISAARFLQEGEIIILAIRPGAWFIVLASWPVLAVAGLLTGILYLAGDRLHLAVPMAEQTVYLICSAAACVRVVASCIQWLGRLYVLTNLRMVRLRGLITPDIYSCPLKRVRRTIMAATRGERLGGVGSLLFELSAPDGQTATPPEAAWVNISRPAEVKDIVDQAISRAR